MKKLILLTVALISINCLGQFAIDFDTMYVIYENDIIQRPNHLDKLNELQMLSDMAPLFLAWDEYSTECYNDSVKRCGYNYKNPITLTNGINLDACDNTLVMFPEYECVWIHKEPTFPDFMEWLKAKYNNL